MNKSIEELPAGWKEEVIERSKNGHNRIELLEYLEINDEMHGKIMGANPEYSEIMSMCKVYHDAYWHRIFREAIQDKKGFDSNGWKTYMQQHCDFVGGKQKSPMRKANEKLREEELKSRFLNGGGRNEETKETELDS